MRQNLSRAIDNMRTIHDRYINGGAPADELVASCAAILAAADAPPVPNGAPWTPDRVDQLRDLWDQGLSANHIAESLGGTNRNAVIGKAHRLGLSNRPSPIKAKSE